MLLQMAGMWEDRQVIETKDTTDISDYSEEDINKALEKIKRIRKTDNKKSEDELPFQ